MHTELSKFGELENLSVCDNICNHLAGNVYVKFSREEEAQAALNSLRGRFYAGNYAPSQKQVCLLCLFKIHGNEQDVQLFASIVQ